jgi:hypothetical protein
MPNGIARVKWRRTLVPAAIVDPILKTNEQIES